MLLGLEPDYVYPFFGAVFLGIRWRLNKRGLAVSEASLEKWVVAISVSLFLLFLTIATALAGFNSNLDGKVNATDAGFSELRVWQDANSGCVALKIVGANFRIFLLY